MPVLAVNRCKRCGGTLIPDNDEDGVQRCILCCRPYDSEGGPIPLRNPILEGIKRRSSGRRRHPTKGGKTW